MRSTVPLCQTGPEFSGLFLSRVMPNLPFAVFITWIVTFTFGAALGTRRTKSCHPASHSRLEITIVFLFLTPLARPELLLLLLREVVNSRSWRRS